ncbi:salicylate hydroxylase [Sporothrix brasiliensis 5110]|uniref:Salicylate hydroxylase n=1 Tax=Sporothrix brasiliensis 5110 TaxID=1398154 RepID=A0A0C2EX75_9PEZI|nr:salicylate hydroxylase [Sporothrix brasiliensis 5110]KIH91179.1 salicylate hydroxylase [Sporothrix brasiliensis 5110]
MAADNARPFRVAVAGSGIAGLAVAIALKQHPGIRVDLYERATQLREIGASIALGPNGMRTLDRLGVANALVDAADDAANGLSFRNASGFPMVYRHYKTGEIVSTDASQADKNILKRHWTARYYRAHLQESLAAHVDPQQIHLSKAFSSVAWDPAKGELVLSFADGSTAAADLLVGADGLHSRVRTFFVPASRPQWTGSLALRSVFPRAHVAHIEGLPHEATHVWGHDRNLFFSPLGRDLYTVVGQVQYDPAEDTAAPGGGAGPDLRDTAKAWASDGSLETLRGLYTSWGSLAKNLVNAVPHIELYPNSSSDSLPTWVLSGTTANVPAGRVTLVGDAAHAHGGAFATGGSLALDDAWAFAAALLHVFPPTAAATAQPSTADLLHAVHIYEKTRKGHTDRLLRIVHASNQARVESLRASLRPGYVPETDEQLRARIRNRTDATWLHEHDVQASFAAAVREVEQGGPVEQSRL